MISVCVWGGRGCVCVWGWILIIQTTNDKLAYNNQTFFPQIHKVKTYVFKTNKGFYYNVFFIISYPI